MKYRAKRRTVEVFKITVEEFISMVKNNASLHCEWITDSIKRKDIIIEDGCIYVENGFYTWHATFGDYIIKDKDGLFVEYEEFFDKKYEVYHEV